MSPDSNTPAEARTAKPEYARAGSAKGRTPRPSNPGRFEQLDADLVVGKGTPKSPLPLHTRRLGIDLVMQAGKSRVAHLDRRIKDAYTPTQLAQSLARLARWPAGNPIIQNVDDDGRVHLRPLPPDGGWIKSYRWLYEAKKWPFD